uniref:Uncharacterized protein n=1 Tax=Daphnia magna TaxID=35525 RepID=A0A0P4X694_9CRUS
MGWLFSEEELHRAARQMSSTGQNFLLVPSNNPNKKWWSPFTSCRRNSQRRHVRNLLDRIELNSTGCCSSACLRVRRADQEPKSCWIFHISSRAHASLCTKKSSSRLYIFSVSGIERNKNKR